MKPETGGKIKYGVWGLIIGGAMAMIIGFSWGGWITDTTAQEMAEEAILANQSAICVAQFIADPNYEEKLNELGELDSWKRSKFIEEGGWDKMPGQDKADHSVSRACAEGLEHLRKSTR
jgi:hypothetical protein